MQTQTQIAKIMGPTWGPSGSFRPQMGPMLALWSLLSEDASVMREMKVQMLLNADASV